VLNDIEQGVAFETAYKVVKIDSALFSYLNGNEKNPKFYEQEMVGMFKEKDGMSSLAIKEMASSFKIQNIGEVSNLL
jgi:hypothetical protein